MATKPEKGGMPARFIAGMKNRMPTTGEIRESDREDEDDDERQLEFDSVITHTEAMEAAAAEASGSVTQWELDWDDGRQEYNVELEDDVDVTIDALSGEILEVDN